MKYIAEDLKSKKIKKLALMLQELDVNIYIFGNKGVGKTYLANFIGNAHIIENFNKLKTFPKIEKRLIGIGDTALEENIKNKFDIAVEIELQDLEKRPDDIEKFSDFFVMQIKQELKLTKEFEVNIDISENLNSLKRSIYKSALCQINTKNEIIQILQNYFDNHYNDNSSYNEQLKLFDEALITSIHKKHKSKLQMAKILKINRATLSKKVEEIENKIT